MSSIDGIVPRNSLRRMRKDKGPVLVGKPFSPPPVSVELPPRKNKKKLLVLLALAFMLVIGGLGLLKLSLGKGRGKEADEALAMLKDKQRDWWENQGFSEQPVKDADAAFQDLQNKQRGWWETQQLAKPNDPNGGEALKHLEEMQRGWWEKEGLAKGETPQDKARALARLDDINRKWWDREQPGKLTGEQASTAMDDDDANVADTNEPAMPLDGAALADLKVKLAKNKGTEEFLKAGGTEDSEKAVQLGLQWLAAQQQNDGRWTPQGGRNGKRTGNDVASTAFALLPFLARGETHKGSQDMHMYTKVVENGLRFLIMVQKPSGEVQEGGGRMYTHALATIAMCEALGMTSDPALKAPCQKAIDYLVKAQARDGGWRYTVAPAAGDMSVSSWCLMGLKSGQMAGLNVPRETLDKATDFLKKVSRNDGGYNYVPGSPGHSPPTPAVMTAAGIVCRQYLQSNSGKAGGTEDVHSQTMVRGLDIILNHPPQQNVHNFYYYYYATYAVFPVGGEAWEKWNPQCRDLLVSWQDKGDKNPALRGSWDSQGAYQLQAAGRVGVTSLALLTLEVYYRHLQLNRPELGEMAKDLDTNKRK